MRTLTAKREGKETYSSSGLALAQPTSPARSPDRATSDRQSLLRHRQYGIQVGRSCPGRVSAFALRTAYRNTQLRGKQRMREADPSTVRFFCGHERWAPRVLERQVRQGMWFVADVSPDVIFPRCPLFSSKFSHERVPSSLAMHCCSKLIIPPQNRTQGVPLASGEDCLSSWVKTTLLWPSSPI